MAQAGQALGPGDAELGAGSPWRGCAGNLLSIGIPSPHQRKLVLDTAGFQAMLKAWLGAAWAVCKGSGRGVHHVLLHPFPCLLVSCQGKTSAEQNLHWFACT